jgi:hypothetical protein
VDTVSSLAPKVAEKRLLALLLAPGVVPAPSLLPPGSPDRLQLLACALLCFIMGSIILGVRLELTGRERQASFGSSVFKFYSNSFLVDLILCL